MKCLHKKIPYFFLLYLKLQDRPRVFPYDISHTSSKPVAYGSQPLQNPQHLVNRKNKNVLDGYIQNSI